ncbi:aminotransferase class I/II-fold pyridoxal phosphate-dependent enzyme [Mycobacterium angelicum]|uniref:aminotransferase class I/II-fold pyridoxal phosphate-dependent enzyme n=1 Tax=Mycobacterium angelicum TaxID=470074 RepID=UPI001B807063|nr:aminotransferase class I/II-fold pyridoxal phosphate-dependent enzyme [Mycobacterium angelicum]
MPTPAERLAILDESVTEGVSDGLLHLEPQDASFGGRVITLAGREHVSFGSCSYLGLELDPRLREATIEAVGRYGTQFSSSRAYLQSPQYSELEALLDRMFGGHVLVVPTTTLGHLATLPVLVGEHDVVLLDHQVHASVQMAANQLRVLGAEIDVIRHNDMDRLEALIERGGKTHDKIWYFADGVYSMFADVAPFERLRDLLDRHERLHLYIDDSHGVGWAGKHGRGPALDVLGGHPRVVAACSLNKSFAAAGGAMVFPDAELYRRVRTVGGPMIFSGPIQPPMLGAAIQSAKIHLSGELPRLQADLRRRIHLFNTLADEYEIPLATKELTPIRYIPLGLPAVTRDVIKNAIADGMYLNAGVFPAVPMNHSGVRATLTRHHTLDDVRALLKSLARHVPAALDRGGDAAQLRHVEVITNLQLRLEHRRWADELDATEWDALLGDRGTFTVAGLRFLERVFGRPGGGPEDVWQFHYYIVRDGSGRAILATFFTAALWKDDMLASAEVSERVERRRAEDRYYLTSLHFAMGSLLTEGDHLYLDRSANWRGALGLLLAAVAEHAGAAGAGTIVLRDLDAADLELAAAIRAAGYVRTSLPESLVCESVADSDEAWLAGLKQKQRWHQRRRVLPFDDTYEVEFLRRGSREVSDAELDHFYELYRAVQRRGLALNVFPLPKRILREMLSHDAWELMVLRLPETGEVVSFGALFVGVSHYAPILIGLDYRYVTSHGLYRQMLRHALRRAREHGAARVLLGMGATIEKERFGARSHARVAFAQASDHYAAEVLAALAADSRGA